MFKVLLNLSLPLPFGLWLADHFFPPIQSKSDAKIPQNLKTLVLWVKL